MGKFVIHAAASEIREMALLEKEIVIAARMGRNTGRYCKRRNVHSPENQKFKTQELVYRPRRTRFEAPA